MTIVYEKGGVRTVLKQRMSASIEGSVLLLAGIGYEFIERGAARGWHLDTITLSVAANGQELVGTKTDTRGRSGPVRFERAAVLVLVIDAGTADTCTVSLAPSFDKRIDANALAPMPVR